MAGMRAGFAAVVVAAPLALAAVVGVGADQRGHLLARLLHLLAGLMTVAMSR